MKKAFKVLICVGACAGAAALPLLGLELLAPPVVALAGAMAAAWGVSYLMPVVTAGIIGILCKGITVSDGAWGFSPTAAIVCEAVVFALLCAAVFVFLRRRLANRHALFAYTAVLCIGVYLMMTLGSLLSGEGPYAGVTDYLQGIDKEFSEALGSAYSREMEESIHTIISAVPDMLMLFTLIIAETVGFAVLMLSRTFCRAFGFAPAPMAELERWRLPKSILWGTLVTAAVCAAAFILKLSISASLAWAMGFVFVSMYAVQGMAYTAFIYKRLKAGTALRVVTWILVFLFVPYSLFVLALMGFIEQITKKRGMVEAYERRLAMERRLRKEQDDYDKYGYSSKDLKGGGPKEGSDNGDGKNENRNDRP